MTPVKGCYDLPAAKLQGLSLNCCFLMHSELQNVLESQTYLLFGSCGPQNQLKTRNVYSWNHPDLLNQNSGE